jgi:hypothetical protein
MGSYRFRERLIRPATTLYALGEFSSFQNSPTDEYIARQVDDLVKDWKLQPQRYLAQYDFDNNGVIQKREWQAIRSAARKQVLGILNSQGGEQHLLSAPRDPGLPYILSATVEEDLVARKKLAAWFSVAIAFLVFIAVVILFSLRPPFPS